MSSDGFIIRPIKGEELEEAYLLERSCYPAEVAATLEAFRFRHTSYPLYFWSAWSGGRLCGIANGVRTHAATTADNEAKGAHASAGDGSHLCVLTVAVAHQERRQGIGAELMKAIVGQARADGLQSIVLMCEEPLIAFYASLGFQYVSVSGSRHGGIEWHEMSCLLEGAGLAGR